MLVVTSYNAIAAEVELTIRERLIIEELMPLTGSYHYLKNVESFISQNAITADEAKLYDIRFDGKQYTWSADADNYTVKIDIPLDVYNEVKAELIYRDEKQLLNLKHISLYEKFVGGGNTAAPDVTVSGDADNGTN